jgi:2-iminobutanoate/2-iminopropanoate deaminase
MRLIVVLVLLLAVPSLLGAQPAPSPGPRFLGPANPTATPPFSPAVRVGDVVHLSGMLGIVPETGRLAEGGIEAETQQTLRNIEATLRRLNLDMTAVFKCMVILADIGDFQAMNRAYVPFFTAGSRPTRTTFQGGLVLGARVEIECQAFAGGS